MDTTPTRRPDVKLLVLVTVALIAGVTIAIVLAMRPVRTYPDGSPERAAQRYLQALYDGDTEVALQLLSAELADGCRSGEPLTPMARNDETVRFTDVRRVGDRVEIDLALSSIDGDVFPDVLFDDPFYDPRSDVELVLEPRDGDWMITEAAWPVYRCTGR